MMPLRRWRGGIRGQFAPKPVVEATGLGETSPREGTIFLGQGDDIVITICGRAGQANGHRQASSSAESSHAEGQRPRSVDETPPTRLDSCVSRCTVSDVVDDAVYPPVTASDVETMS